MRLFMKWLVCAAALFLSAQIFPERVLLAGGWVSLLACATVLWLLNLFLRPVLQVLALPFSLVTLGLFSFVVNGIVVALSAALIPGFAIHGFFACLVTALLVSAGNLLFARKSRRD